MQVGSLVVYISQFKYLDMITPDHSAIYTVRDILPCTSIQRPDAHDGIRLEEIINGNIALNGQLAKGELAYIAEHFVEVQPPMAINFEEFLSIPDKIKLAS